MTVRSLAAVAAHLVRVRRRGTRILAFVPAVAVALAVLGAASPAEAADDTTTANGQGSTYVGIAMQQWISQAQLQGIPVNYTATNSPAGLQAFADSQADFAGTEAEFASLGESNNVARGWQYTPDVAGAVAIMYNVDTADGQPVTYLHLSAMTIAEIFMGKITNWDDPAIAADNHGLQLPDHPITVVYRAGQSGTTALFYDFVYQTDPSYYTQWAATCGYPAYPVRIIELDTCKFAPSTVAFSGSDQEAEYVASAQGLWSIGYDEFAYPKQYGAQVAWVENASDNWVQPYATNISAALQYATLNQDLSQNLDGVYTSTNPLVYPISAYSYIVTQCATTPSWPTCKGPYSNSGTAQTLGDFMSYIACGGQTDMAQLGYSPLPPVLSQDMMNAVARMTGASNPVTVSASNCNDPTFSGSLGMGATNPNQDPYAGCTSPDALAPGGPGCGGGISAPPTTTTTVPTTTTTAGPANGTTTTVGPSGQSPTPTTVSGQQPGSSPSGGTTTTAGQASASPGGATSWVPTAALGPPVSVETKKGTPVTVSASYGGASASLSVPAGALPAGTVVSLYPVASPSVLAADLPAGLSYVTCFGVLWKGPDGAPTTAATPVTLSLSDAGIDPGAAVVELSQAGRATLGTLSSGGGFRISLSAVALFLVAQRGGPGPITATPTRPARPSGSGPTTSLATTKVQTTSPRTLPGTPPTTREFPTSTSVKSKSPLLTGTTTPETSVIGPTATAHPVVATTHSVVATTHPVVATTHPVVATAHPVVATTHSVVATAPSVVATTHPVVATAPSVVATAHSVVASTQPVVTATPAAGLATTTSAGNAVVAAAPTTSPYRPVHAVVYDRPVPRGIPASPLVALLLVLAVPPLLVGFAPRARRLRIRRRGRSTEGTKPGLTNPEVTT